MRRRPTLALALVSALTGCVSAPPDGPLVEFRDGLTPVTRPVECEGTYSLVAVGSSRPVVEHRAVKGERLGFRREPDGSVVAVAPGYTFPLDPGAYVWAVTPGSVKPYRERLLCETRDRALTAAKWAGIAVLAVVAAMGVLAILVVIAWAN